MPETIWSLKPQQCRLKIRKGLYSGVTSELCPGYQQANLTVIPSSAATDFALFCRRNAQACPLLAALSNGDFNPHQLAQAADIRTDLPRYLLLKHHNGKLTVKALVDICEHWNVSCCTFLTGCSFTFDHALIRFGIIPRHIEQKTNVPMFVTNRKTQPAGIFSGPLTVSMRPVPHQVLQQVINLTRRYPYAHGEPVAIGSPDQLGIESLDRPDFGEPVSIRKSETPVYWACGVTAQMAIRHALLNKSIDWAITHQPGHMFICDLPAAA